MADNGAAVARARLAGALRDSGRTPSPAVQAAFAEVPRHLFVPELRIADAYQDEAFVIKCDPSGLPVSSSSQPAMMAIMLEQLELGPGQRVLEVGTGTGFNAALMAHIVGPAGTVTTVDIDPELVDRAMASLATAGFGTVRVRCADGGFGEPSGAPYDRIMVTAGAWDLAPAWLDQLAPGGRLVLPLSVRGIQLSVCLARSDGDSWVKTTAWRCGFVRVAGAFAGPEANALALAPDLFVQVADGRPADGSAIRAALAGPAADIAAGVFVTDGAELGDLDLWLTLTELSLDRLTLLSAAESRAAAGPLMPFGGLASQPSGPDRLGIGVLGAEQTADGLMVMVRGYGPGGGPLAVHLARQVLAWAGQGRPGVADLAMTVWPTGSQVPDQPGQVVLDRPNARIAAGWPVR